MKHGILIGIGVFALSVIGAAVAATAYFKYRQSQIFDEYEEELANDDYYSAKVEPTQEKTVVIEVCTNNSDNTQDQNTASNDNNDADIDFIDDEDIADEDFDVENDTENTEK